MEVMVPTKEFHFDSTTSTPYVSAPTSPKCFHIDPFDYYCHYTSAPTSPARAAAIYAASVVPFDWEETPGTPKSRKSPADDDDDDGGDDNNDEYVFEFSGHLDALPPKFAAADELFEEGKIRPLKPPPRLYMASSPRSPRSPKGRLWSPRHKKKSDGGGTDPSAVATAEVTWERGRGRSVVPSPSLTPSFTSRKGSRSLSPMRGESMGSLMQSPADSPSQASTSAASAVPSAKNIGGGNSSKKWRLRDLLLFRSASEGRATGNTSKDPLRKFSILTSSPPIKRGGEDSRNSSFRSTDSVGSSTTRRGGMSPHEMHYTSNRAASEETKRRTALPYGSNGLFGCLRFNPAVQSVARGFHNSSTFNHRRQL